MAASRVIAGAVLLFVLVTVWAAPRPAADTFMGLAGGRDVFEGKLGKPDDWSFTTAGRVWPHQNWGFDALLYAAVRAHGEGGLLALKAFLVVTIAAAVVMAARRRGAGWASALLVTAAAMAGTRQYMELRANLATYLMAALLLLILYGSHRRPRLLWLSVPLVAAWANLHGGFVLGLAVLGVWTAACALAGLRSDGVAGAAESAWRPASVLGASVAAAALLSPLGLTNLTHPFTIARDAEWRTITEWQPVPFSPGAGTTSAWELVGLVAFMTFTTVWRALARRPSTEALGGDASARFRLASFDAGLVLLATWMGVSAIRFLPLALVVLAPLAAAQAEFVFHGPRPWLPASAGATVLAAALLPFATDVAATYAAGNPRFRGESFFLRMAGNDRLPAAAADFLLDNHIVGRVFADWTWEGYLRWRCPQLSVFIGGRAQQVYDVETLREYIRFGSGPRPDAMLARWDTHLLTVPMTKEFQDVVDRLAFSEGAHWALVFYDGRTAVLADLSSPETRSLAERVAAGRARFRFGPVGALSETLCRLTNAAGSGVQALSGLADANRALPTAGGPWFVLFAARAQRVAPESVVLTLESEYEVLTGGRPRADQRLGTLESRLNIAQILVDLYGPAPEAKRWSIIREDLLSELQELIRNP